MAETQDMSIRPGYEQRTDARGDPRLDWWRDARFGMFIHWGLYALDHSRWSEYPPAVTHHYTGEWVQHVRRIPREVYRRSADEFDPTGFDADEWVALAKDAGMRYMVITAKHHDGFCLFRSATTDFNIADATPFGRDVIAELADACHRAKLPFGVYYSQTQDWSHPHAEGNAWDFDPARRDFETYLDDTVRPHLRELLGNYGPIGLVWFDTPMGMNYEQSRSLVDLVHKLQPECLVSGRIGNGLGDYASFRDNRYPAHAQPMDWESPATMNRTWGYVGDDHAWKSSRELLHTLIDTVSKGGNFLLNVGPDSLGRIPQPSQDILRRMGRSLAGNGEGIYATRVGPVQDNKWIRTTTDPRTGNRFVHIVTWPLGDSLVLPEELADAGTVRVLAGGAELPIESAGGNPAVPLPAGLRSELPVTLRITQKERNGGRDHG
jgi:alpha-L-fucosidase